MKKISSPKDDEPKRGWSLPCLRRKNRDKQVLKLIKELMASQAEQIALLKEVAADLTSANELLVKVAGEADKQNQKIVDLEAALANQDNASQELVDAVAAVKAQAAVVRSGIAAVDEKVPDAPPV